MNDDLFLDETMVDELEPYLDLRICDVMWKGCSVRILLTDSDSYTGEGWNLPLCKKNEDKIGFVYPQFVKTEIVIHFPFDSIILNANVKRTMTRNKLKDLNETLVVVFPESLIYQTLSLVGELPEEGFLENEGIAIRYNDTLRSLLKTTAQFSDHLAIEFYRSKGKIEDVKSIHQA